MENNLKDSYTSEIPEIIEPVELKSCEHCGDPVPEKRTDFLIKYKKPIICIGCAEGTVKKVTGFQINHGKGTREIEVCTPEQGQRLMKMERKTGGATGGPGIHKNAGKVVYKG
jgi:hypothetical protein